MKPNKVQFLTSQGPVEVTKPNVYEADLHDDAVRGRLPRLAQLFESHEVELVRLMNDTWPELNLTCHKDDPAAHAKTFTLKLQANDGGCFPWHYDNPSKPNKRRMTFALYLCEDWSTDVGGEVVVMPFLQPQVVVAPRFNRLLLFRSDLTLHRVLPVRHGAAASEGKSTAASSSPFTRYCFTIWMDSETTNADDDVNLRAKHLDMPTDKWLTATPLQRAVARAVYDDEFLRSANECFGPGSREAKLSNAIHEAHVKPLRANQAVWAFVQRLRGERPAGDCDDATTRSGPYAS